MAAHPERLLRHLRRLVIAPSSDPATDAGLLDRFVRCNDEDAFATLVARHGPMVFGVCRRVLRDAHQAEDVAQATFLVLASKARTIRRADALAAWLHRTAQHLALKSRRTDTCRRQREMRSYLASADTSQPDPLDELTVRELLAIFDEELQRLRTAYRLPLILCCLEGQTQEKAARQLGWSPGAVKGRLERGRAQLHRRLVKRGVSLSAVLVALEGLHGTSSALGMPPGFITATLLAAARFVATTRNTDATIAAGPLTLADEAVRRMAVAKTKIMLALLLTVGVAVAGVGALTRQGLAARQEEERQADEPQLRSGAVEQRKPVDAKQPARADRLADPLPVGALTRLGTLRWRVPGEVASIAFAPNGKVVAIASLPGGDPRNHGLYFFDAANGKLTQHIGLADTFFERIAFSPDGRRLACTCTVEADDRHKNTVQIWEWPDGRKIREFDGAGLQWLGWSADGEPLGIFLANGAVLLRKLAGNEHQFEAKDLPDHGRDLGRCAYAAGGKILAVPDERAIIHVWDTATGKERCALQAKGDYVRSVALTPDGRTVASLAWGPDISRTVQLWDVASGKVTHTVVVSRENQTAVAFTPDGKTLSTIGWLGVRFWDVATGRARGRTQGVDSFAPSVAFPADSNTLATTENYSGVIHLWDVATGTLKPAASGQTSPPYSVAFSPDGQRLASGGMDGTIFVWDLATGTSLARVHWGGWVRDCAFSADGALLFSCWTGDRLHFSDAATGRELHSVKLDDPDRPDTKQSGLRMDLSDNGKTLVAFSDYKSTKPGVRVSSEILVTGWDTITHKQLFRRKRERFDFGIAVSPDAKALAVHHGGGDPATKKMQGGSGREPLLLEDLATGEHLLSFPVVVGQTRPIRFSLDGRLLATNTSGPDGTGHTLRLWEVATAAEVLAFPTVLNSRVAFSPDSRVVAVTTPAQEILLWDLRRGKEVQRFTRYKADVTSLAFSPDGRRLVSGLSDSTLLVWDVAAVRHAAQPSGLDAEGAARAWADLASDARKAFAARGALAESPARALPLLKERLRPAPPTDVPRLRRLIADLDSDRFAARQEAQKGLEQMGDLAKGGLQRALAEKPSLEARQRIIALLEKLRSPVTRPETLQALRAVAVLEDIATPEARQLLETLARGELEARLTQQAKASFDRLAKRPTAKP